MKKLVSYVLILAVIFASVLAINNVFAISASDTSEPPDYDIDAKANILREMGILKGGSSGNFNLESTLTRSEAATLLVRLYGSENSVPPESDIFTDVPASHWAADNINNAYALGFVKGVSFDRFDPDRPVSANEFCIMLMRVMVPNANMADGAAFRYYAGYSGITLLAAKAAVDKNTFYRKDMVTMLYNTVTKNYISENLSPVMQNETYSGYGFNITLQSNPSAGYSLSYSVSASGMIEKTGETSESTAPGLQGAPLNTVYSFRALKPGSVNITFTCKSPSGDVAYTRTYKLIIDDTSNIEELTSSSKVPLGESRIIRLETNVQPGYVWSYRVSDTINYYIAPTPTQSVSSTATPVPNTPSVIATHTPTPLQFVDGGYLANCVLTRIVPNGDGKAIQEYVVKTYLYGTSRINFYYMSASSGIASTTTPLKSFTLSIV